MFRFNLTRLATLGAMLALCSTANADFTPIAGFDRQLFPSYLIATATFRPSNPVSNPDRLGDPRGLLGVEIVAPQDDTLVTVTVECGDLFETSQFSGTLPKAGHTYRITPRIKYDYQRLAQFDQAAPASVTFTVDVGSEPTESQTVICTIRSINDCPFAYKDGDETIDIGYTFAAYVNEQHPFVDKLLREALDVGTVDSFVGYQGDEQAVIRQAYALWDLLVRRDIRYSSITTSAVASESVASQHVRLIEDSINNSQANCVDGSVLWVSLMRKIGIDAFLVIEADHCYAGFFASRGGKNMYGIETVLMGNAIVLEQVEIPDTIKSAIPEKMQANRSFPSFVAAINVGTKNLVKSLEKPEEERDPEWQIINIASARKQGIMPIAFQNKEEFNYFDLSDDTTDNDEPQPTSTSSNRRPNTGNSTASRSTVPQRPSGVATGRSPAAPSVTAGTPAVNPSGFIPAITIRPGSGTTGSSRIGTPGGSTTTSTSTTTTSTTAAATTASTASSPSSTATSSTDTDDADDDSTSDSADEDSSDADSADSDSSDDDSSDADDDSADDGSSDDSSSDDSGDDTDE